MTRTLLAALAALAFLPLASGQTDPAQAFPAPPGDGFLQFVDLDLQKTVLPFGIQLDLHGVSELPLADVTVEQFRGTTGVEEPLGPAQHQSALSGMFDLTTVLPWSGLTEEWFRVAVSDDSNDAYQYYHGFIVHALPGGAVTVEDEAVPFVADRWTGEDAAFALPVLPADLYGAARPYPTPVPLDGGALPGLGGLADGATARAPPAPSTGDLLAPLSLVPQVSLAAAGPEDPEEGVLRDNYPYKTTITGTVKATYGGQYPASFPTPAVCSLCMVDVWDSDAGQLVDPESDLLGTVITSMSGTFSLTVSNWDLADSGVDPFLVVRFDYSNSPVNQGTSTYQTPVLRTNCANSLTCSLGTHQVAGTSWAAPKVFIAKAMADGWKAANDQAAWNIGKVTVQIDENHGGHSDYDDLDRIIRIGGNHKWNQMVLNHEQGHYVMHKARNFGSFPNACGGHTLTTYSNAKCAWDEGFAYFWALVASNTATFKDSNGATVNVENIHNVIPAPYLAPTDHYEGFVAGTLWDLLDAPMDGSDIYDQSLAQVLQPMRSWLVENSLYDYYIHWGSTGYATVIFKECAKQNKVLY